MICNITIECYNNTMIFDHLLDLVSRSGSGINICSDSRQVKKGDCFVAVTGTQTDGHDFIDRAIQNGAAYIVSQKPISTAGTETIIVDSSAAALAGLAQASLGNPSAKLTNLAVTGTNGKTTVCYLVRSIFHAAGENCGLIGTIIYDTGDATENAPLTTPDALSIARLARKMVDSGAKFMAIEASSHALHQHRLAGLNFSAAAFTNLTGDHLDYHKTTEDYLAAKTLLFKNLSPEATSVLNADSLASKRIAQKTKSKILWYSIDSPADITASIETMDEDRTVYQLKYQKQTELIKTPLAGLHNISNQLAAAGLALAAGLDLPTIAKGLASLTFVPGRLQPIDRGQKFKVFVDYAHTDDALKNVLNTLSPLCKRKLIVVFGCGGDRDRLKRPRMAQAAEELADIIFVTNDNPRTEPALRIIEDIVAGFSDPYAKNITIEPDRKKAITLAIRSAHPSDIVLIAGKGHEDYQIIGTKRIDLDDRQIAREVLGDMAAGGQ